MYALLGARIRLACHEEGAGICTSWGPVLVFVNKTEDECRMIHGDWGVLNRRAIYNGSDWVAWPEYLGCRGL